MKAKKTTTTFDGRKGVGHEVLELPIGFLRDDTGQVVNNETGEVVKKSIMTRSKEQITGGSWCPLQVNVITFLNKVQ